MPNELQECGVPALGQRYGTLTVGAGTSTKIMCHFPATHRKVQCSFIMLYPLTSDKKLVSENEPCRQGIYVKGMIIAPQFHWLSTPKKCSCFVAKVETKPCLDKPFVSVESYNLMEWMQSTEYRITRILIRLWLISILQMKKKTPVATMIWEG